MSELTDDLSFFLIAGIDNEQTRNELVNRVAALEAENAALKEANQWHPASEPPEKRGDYIVVGNDKEGEQLEWICYFLETPPNQWCTSYVINFWRELPAPPEVV